MGWQSIKYIADWPVQCLCDTHVEYNLYWMEDDEEVGKDHWKRLNWRRPTKTSKNSLVQTHSQFHSYEYSRVLVVKVRCNITNNNGGKKCNHMYRCIHCAAVAHWDLVFNRPLVWTVAIADRSRLLFSCGSFDILIVLRLCLPSGNRIEILSYSIHWRRAGTRGEDDHCGDHRSIKIIKIRAIDWSCSIPVDDQRLLWNSALVCESSE